MTDRPSEPPSSDTAPSDPDSGLIRSLTLSGFRRFERLTVPRFARVNLLIGRNGVGRTSILEALALHLTSHNPAFVLDLNRYRGLSEFSATPESIWGWLFRGVEKSRPIRIRLARGQRETELAISHEPAPEASLSNGMAGSDDGTSLLASLTLDYPDYRGQATSSGIQLSGRGPIFRLGERSTDQPLVMIPRLGGTSKQPASWLSALVIANREEEVNSLLREISPAWRSITTVADGGTVSVYADVGLEYKIPLAMVGEGAVRIVSLILGGLSSRNGVLLVDELDRGLHWTAFPSLWRALFALAHRQNVQIFCTSHSQDCLVGLSEYLASENCPASHRSSVAIHKLISEPKGGTRAVRYDSESLAVAIRDEWEIR